MMVRWIIWGRLLGAVLLLMMEAVIGGEKCEIKSGGSSMVCNCDDGKGNPLSMTMLELDTTLKDERIDVGALTLM